MKANENVTQDCSNHGISTIIHCLCNVCSITWLLCNPYMQYMFGVLTDRPLQERRGKAPKAGRTHRCRTGNGVVTAGVSAPLHPSVVYQLLPLSLVNLLWFSVFQVVSSWFSQTSTKYYYLDQMLAAYVSGFFATFVHWSWLFSRASLSLSLF